MEDEVRITLRLPADLHGDIVDLAARYKASLNSQIVTMLRDWFVDDPRVIAVERRLAAIESRVAAEPQRELEGVR